ncbi:MAG: GNAT family N-acetyltransferase [Geminicoccaceae bacterium]
MAADFDNSIAFRAACDLVFEAAQPSGYASPYRRRAEVKLPEPVIVRRSTHSGCSDIRRCARRPMQCMSSASDASPRPWSRISLRPTAKGHVDLAETAEGGMVGFIHLYPRGDHIFIENVAIHPDHQGSGHGRLLLHHAEDQASRAGLSAIELYTNEKMNENLTLYPARASTKPARAIENNCPRLFQEGNLTQR